MLLQRTASALFHGRHSKKTSVRTRLGAAKQMDLERGASEAVALVAARLAMSWKCLTDASRGIKPTKPVAALPAQNIRVFYM
jgi:hypothetical protein